jgi:hypothetical protein
MPALITIAALALLAEFAAVMRCAICGIPFGRSFGYSILAQVALPVLFFAVFFIWGFVSPPSYGVEPLAGEAWVRGWIFIGSVFWLEFFATLVAGSLGVARVFVSAPVNDNSRNA